MQIHKQHDQIYVWHILSGECVHVFRSHNSPIVGFATIHHDINPPINSAGTSTVLTSSPAVILSASATETLLWNSFTGEIMNSFPTNLPSNIISDNTVSNRIALMWPNNRMAEVWEFGRTSRAPVKTQFKGGTQMKRSNL